MNYGQGIRQGPIGGSRIGDPIGDVWEGNWLSKEQRVKKMEEAREGGRSARKVRGKEFRKGMDPNKKESEPHGIRDCPEFADHELGRILRLRKEGWTLAAIGEEYGTTAQATSSLLRAIKAWISG